MSETPEAVMDDASREFLETLPELEPGGTFRFACNPEVPCFNRCCAELTLPLTPYDVLRLRRHFNTDSETFLNTHTRMRTFPDTGFPLPLLRMLEGPGEPCPFVTPAGCSIYEDRPGACRCYPLGRGAKMAREGGVEERFFIVREPHCHGFDLGRDWTAGEWLADQGLDVFNAANDRYMRLMSMVRASGKPLEARMATMAVLCLYQLDKFRELIEQMRIFSRVELSEERRNAIMSRDEDTLDFALDWMELIIFGQSDGLKKHG